MTDGEFLRALESCTLPESEYSAIMRMSARLTCTSRSPTLPRALDRIRRSIRAHATHPWETRSISQRQTISVAYLALIPAMHFRARGRWWLGGICAK